MIGGEVQWGCLRAMRHVIPGTVSYTEAGLKAGCRAFKPDNGDPKRANPRRARRLSEGGAEK